MLSCRPAHAARHSESAGWEPLASAPTAWRYPRICALESSSGWVVTRVAAGGTTRRHCRASVRHRGTDRPARTARRACPGENVRYTRPHNSAPDGTWRRHLRLQTITGLRGGTRSRRRGRLDVPGRRAGPNATHGATGWWASRSTTNGEVAMAASRGMARGTRRRRLGGLGCFVAVLVASAWGSAPASATTIDRFHGAQPYDEIRWDCGYPMEVAARRPTWWWSAPTRSSRATCSSPTTTGSRRPGPPPTAGGSRSGQGPQQGRQGQARRRIRLRIHLQQPGADDRHRLVREPWSTATGGTSRSPTRSISPPGRSTSSV